MPCQRCSHLYGGRHHATPSRCKQISVDGVPWYIKISDCVVAVDTADLELKGNPSKREPSNTSIDKMAQLLMNPENPCQLIQKVFHTLNTNPKLLVEGRYRAAEKRKLHEATDMRRVRRSFGGGSSSAGCHNP